MPYYNTYKYFYKYTYTIRVCVCVCLCITELCHAATKIQASFRGHMTRKQQAGGKDEPSGAAAPATASKTESLESQLKNVDINKVYHTFYTVIRVRYITLCVVHSSYTILHAPASRKTYYNTHIRSCT